MQFFYSLEDLSKKEYFHLVTVTFLLIDWLVYSFMDKDPALNYIF